MQKKEEKMPEKSETLEGAAVHKMYKDATEKGVRLSFIANREYTLAKDRYTATTRDDFLALALSIRDRLVERWIVTQQR